MSDFDRISDPPMPRFSDPDNDPDWGTDTEPETPEQSAELVDRNLRAMGSAGLSQPDETTHCRTCKREMTSDEFIDHQGSHWLNETRDI